MYQTEIVFGKRVSKDCTGFPGSVCGQHATSHFAFKFTNCGDRGRKTQQKLTGECLNMTDARGRQVHYVMDGKVELNR